MKYTEREMENMRLSVAITEWSLEEIESCEINPQLFVNASRYIDGKLKESIANPGTVFDVENCLEEMQFSGEEVTLSLGWLVVLIGSIVDKERTIELMTEEERVREELLYVSWKNWVDKNRKMADEIQKKTGK
jgi:hypothetical protein